jgi:membrane associated rhomboid family serine protease
MGLHPVWIVGNAVAVQATVITMSYLFYLGVLTRGWRWPWTSTAIITVTALVTGLSFAVPDLLALLRRDTDSLLAGEVWRVITPLFVQPYGLVEVVLNGTLMLMVVPLAERLYGSRGLLVVYFGAGLIGQIASAWWDPTGGGSSPGIFGVIGALLTYVVRHGLGRPASSASPPAIAKPFVVIASLGLLTGPLIALFQDGHGPAIIAGALLSLLLLQPHPVGDTDEPAQRS